MAERQELKDKLRRYLPTKRKEASKRGGFGKTLDVVITTYSYFSSEKSDDRSFLRKFDWDYVSDRTMKSHFALRAITLTNIFDNITDGSRRGSLFEESPWFTI